MRNHIQFSAYFLIFIALLLAACSPAPAPSDTPTRTAAAPSSTATPSASPTPLGGPDLTGETITLYHFCASTGDLAAFNFSAIWAAQDMAAAINQAGGVFGATLDVQLVDTQGSTEGAEAAYSRITSRGEVALILICDAVTELALAPLLAQDDIPALGPGLAPEADYRDPGGALFAFRSTVAHQFVAWLDFLSANWGGLKPAGADEEIRLAFFSLPPELGGQLPVDELEALAAEFGVEIVYQAEIAAERTANVYDLIYAARDENANAVYLNTRAFTAAELLNAIHALGLHERLVLAGPDVAADGLDAYLLVPANLDGVRLTANSAAWSDEEHSAIGLAQQLFLEAGREAEYRNLAYLHTMAAVDIARHVIEQIVLAGGLEDLNAVTVRAALLALDDYDVLGGLYTLAYSNERRYPTELRIYEIDTETASYLLLEEPSP